MRLFFPTILNLIGEILRAFILGVLIFFYYRIELIFVDSESLTVSAKSLFLFIKLLLLFPFDSYNQLCYIIGLTLKLVTLDLT